MSSYPLGVDAARFMPAIEAISCIDLPIGLADGPNIFFKGEGRDSALVGSSNEAANESLGVAVVVV